MSEILSDLNWLQTAHHVALTLRIAVMLYGIRLVGKFVAWMVVAIFGIPE